MSQQAGSSRPYLLNVLWTMRTPDELVTGIFHGLGPRHICFGDVHGVDHTDVINPARLGAELGNAAIYQTPLVAFDLLSIVPERVAHQLLTFGCSGVRVQLVLLLEVPSQGQDVKDLSVTLAADHTGRNVVSWNFILVGSGPAPQTD